MLRAFHIIEHKKKMIHKSQEEIYSKNINANKKKYTYTKVLDIVGNTAQNN